MRAAACILGERIKQSRPLPSPSSAKDENSHPRERRRIRLGDPLERRLTLPPWKSDNSVTFAVKRAHLNDCLHCMNMETTNSIRVRASRFFSDRYAYRARPGYLSELVAFGLIVFTAIWPIILLANAMAAAPR